MKPAILFVDDEPNILKGLQRNLRKMRDEWDMTFVEGGAAALAHIDAHPIDVVITDMRMPGMDGAELLTEVAKRAPNTIRFVLSGQTEREDALRLVNVCHQFMSKPCDADFFVDQAKRALALRDVLPNPELQVHVAGLTGLPSQPGVYDEMVDEFAQPEPSVEKIAELVSRDIALAAKILQIASSGFFGVGRSTPSIAKAVGLLGVKRVEGLVLTYNVVTKYEEQDTAGISLESVWNHSTICANLSHAIATVEKFDEKTAESAFIAGIVHDVGRLILSANEPEQYAAAMTGIADPDSFAGTQAEIESFQASHAMIGAYLAGLWGFPDSVVQAVAHHHTPLECPDQEFGVLTVLHGANYLSHVLQSGGAGPEADAYIDTDYFKNLGLPDKPAEWRKVVDRVMSGGSAT